MLHNASDVAATSPNAFRPLSRSSKQSILRLRISDASSADTNKLGPSESTTSRRPAPAGRFDSESGAEMIQVVAAVRHFGSVGDGLGYKEPSFEGHGATLMLVG